MYFNEKSDTDINKDISKKNKKKKNNNIKNILKNKKLFLVMGIFLLVFIISLILIFTNNTEYYLELSGEEYIKIYEDSEYIEDGYYAYDSNGNDLTNEVIIDNNVDITTIGEYTITYNIMVITKVRKIYVIEKPKIATYIHLKGDEVVYLSINEEYDEPGYTAIDTFDSNLTKKVKVTNNIDNTKAGIYKVTYSVTNSSGVTSSAVRKVIVMDSEVSLSLSNTNPTNSELNINIHITDNYYSYLILPNNNKITSKDYSYKVSSNGEYKFIIYNTKGKSITKSISVTNIDKESPNGTCSGYTQDGKSYITVNATDNVGISKYVSNGVTNNGNIITLSSEVSTPTVTIYDKAGNSKNITCTLERKATLYPNVGENFKQSEIPKSSQKVIDNGDYKLIQKYTNVYVGYYDGNSFWIYIPNDIEKRGLIPLVVYMHGNGERGDDYNTGYTEDYYRGFIRQTVSQGYSYNAIIVQPQIHSGDTWQKNVDLPIKFVNVLMKHYNINKNKISLVGFSNGCYGTKSVMKKYPTYFSAVVPIGCKLEASDSNLINAFKYTPTYAISASDGYYRGSGNMEDFINKLNESGGSGKYAGFTEHASIVGENELNILRNTNVNLMDWILSQERK